MTNVKYRYNNWGPKQNQEKKGPMITSPKFPIQTDNPINAANVAMSLAEN